MIIICYDSEAILQELVVSILEAYQLGRFPRVLTCNNVSGLVLLSRTSHCIVIGFKKSLASPF